MGVTEVKSNDWLAYAIACADKREKLSKQSCICPLCSSRQIQLVEWIVRTRRKCRECGHVFN